MVAFYCWYERDARTSLGIACLIVVIDCLEVVINCFIVVVGCLIVVIGCLIVVIDCLIVVVGCLIVVVGCLIVVYGVFTGILVFFVCGYGLKICVNIHRSVLLLKRTFFFMLLMR